MFPALSQISLKNSFGKVVFQILAKIKMMRNKNRIFGRHFERYSILGFFPELWFLIVHKYMVQMSYMVPISSADGQFISAWYKRKLSDKN